MVVIMRVLISGGGIAGLTLAHFLHQYGMTPVVIERAGGLRQEGYAIDFFGLGYELECVPDACVLSALDSVPYYRVYTFLEGGRRWRRSRLDRWRAGPGLAWKRCGSTNVRACWRNRRAGLRATGSTLRR